MTIQQAAQQALDVQYACNASGIIRSLYEITSGVLWPEANRLGLWSKYVNRPPLAESQSEKIGRPETWRRSTALHGVVSVMREDSLAFSQHCGICLRQMSNLGVRPVGTRLSDR